MQLRQLVMVKAEAKRYMQKYKKIQCDHREKKHEEEKSEIHNNSLKKTN